MGQTNMRPGLVRACSRSGRLVVPYMAVTVKKIYFRPASAGARLDGSWAERLFPLFFSLKLSKIHKEQHKTRAKLARGQARAADKI